MFLLGWDLRMSCRLAAWLQCVVLSGLWTQPFYFVPHPKGPWCCQAVSLAWGSRGLARPSSVGLQQTWPCLVNVHEGPGSWGAQSLVGAGSWAGRPPVKLWEPRPLFLLLFHRLASKRGTHFRDLMSRAILPRSLTPPPHLTHQSVWMLVME